MGQKVPFPYEREVLHSYSLTDNELYDYADVLLQRREPVFYNLYRIKPKETTPNIHTFSEYERHLKSLEIRMYHMQCLLIRLKDMKYGADEAACIDVKRGIDEYDFAGLHDDMKFLLDNFDGLESEIRSSSRSLLRDAQRRQETKEFIRRLFLRHKIQLTRIYLEVECFCRESRGVEFAVSLAEKILPIMVDGTEKKIIAIIAVLLARYGLECFKEKE